jgi:hypothetical protein
LGGQGGGGRPDMAQGGGPDGTAGSEAITAIRRAIESASVPAYSAFSRGGAFNPPASLIASRNSSRFS